MSHYYRLVVSCPDRVGIVARVSSFIAQQGGSITEASQHSDLETGCFFMRYEILADSVGMSAEALRAAFEPVASEFNMPDDKQASFAKVQAEIDSARADCVVLARYMQILPPELCARYAGRVINIHHSFLPSFAGAKPYHQAYQRGVKLIGATCHYVTEELDAGPIIEQDIHRVSHCHTPTDLVRFGRDVEKAVLARGLRWHLEDRVLVHGNKTVVFS